MWNIVADMRPGSCGSMFLESDRGPVSVFQSVSVRRTHHTCLAADVGGPRLVRPADCLLHRRPSDSVAPLDFLSYKLEKKSLGILK